MDIDIPYLFTGKPKLLCMKAETRESLHCT
jgi:hypothetical protein